MSKHKKKKKKRKKRKSINRHGICKIIKTNIIMYLYYIYMGV